MDELATEVWEVLGKTGGAVVCEYAFAVTDSEIVLVWL